MRSLVTGAAGFIGSHLVDRLLSMGHSVIAIDNESAESNENFYWNELAENYKYNICDYELTRKLYENIDYVFHLAAEARIQPSIKNPLLSFKTNTIGTATVLQCSREANVKRVIYSSTSSAYGKNPVPNIETQPDDCLTPYSVSKVAGEKACKMYYELFGLETVILRYFNVYGDRQPLAGEYAPVIGLFERQVKSDQPMTIVGNGEQRRSFTYIDDAIEANISAAYADIPQEFMGTVFNIGYEKNYSINEIAELFGGDKINIPPRLGESKETLPNISKARNILGWKPKYSLEEYLKS